MKKFLLFGLLAVLIIGLVGCSSNSSKTSSKNVTANSQNNSSTTTSNQASADAGTPQKGGTLTVGTLTEPDSLDPAKTGESASNIIMGNIGASLVFRNPKTKKYEPYLAKSWTTTNGGKTWTFKLRQDVKFSNGEPLTAQDFVATFERDMKSNMVVGGNLKEVSDVKAPDKYTLVLDLKAPFAPLLQYLSDPGWLQPLPAKEIKAGKDFSRDPIGVGPYKFGSWKNGQSITLVRNPYYKWAPSYFKNKGPVYPAKLTYKFISETQTMLAALDSGSIDVAARVPASDIKKYQNNSKYYVFSRPRNGLGLFIVFNMKNPNFSSLKVREAINYAVDKNAMVKSILFGQGEVAYGPLPSSFFGYDPNVKNYGYHYDPKKAAQLLKEAGYTKGSNGYLQKNGKTFEVNLLTQTNGSTWKQSATLIQAMLKQVGIKVDIQAHDFGTLLSQATKHQFDMTLMGYTYNDPNVLSLFLKSSQDKGGLNLGSVEDPKLDSLIDKGQTTVDQAQRKAVYAQLQKYIVQKAYWAPLYSEKQFDVVNKKVVGLQLDPLLDLLYQDSWVKQ